MKLYTKTGDGGTTGLFGGARVSKANLRVDAYGTVDEVNAHLGLAAAQVSDDGLRASLIRIQGELFCVGAELASNPDKPLQTGLPMVDEAAVARLEQSIDQLEAALSPLTTFILPGGSVGAGQLHVARAVCRRAERLVVGLTEAAPGSVRGETLRFLNRLSDLLFVMARFDNHKSGLKDVAWAGRE